MDLTLAFGNPECSECGVRHPIGAPCPSEPPGPEYWEGVFARATEDITTNEAAQMTADGWRDVCEQLKTEKERAAELRKAIRRIFNKAVPYTTFVEHGEEFIGSYVVPCGPLHHAIGLAGRDDTEGGHP